MLFQANPYQERHIEFPNHFVNPADKGKEWIKQALEAMYAMYVQDKTAIAYSFRNEIDLLRKYSNGNQPTDKYMDRLFPLDPQTNTRKGYMNLSWDIVSVIPKVKAVVVNILKQTQHDVVANSIDRAAYDEKNAIKWRMWANAKLDASLQNLPESIRRVDDEDQGPLPRSLEQLNMLASIGPKLKQEIGMEGLINWSLYLSKWDVIEDQLYEDLFDLGIAFTKDYVDRNSQRVMTRYVDPRNIISKYSHDRTNGSSGFNGELRHMTIAQLRQDSAGDFTEEELMEIAKIYAGYRSNPNAYDTDTYGAMAGKEDNAIEDIEVLVLDGEYETWNRRFYEKVKSSRGSAKVYDVEYGKQKKDTDKRKTRNSDLNLWYRGKWVVGTDFVYDYGKQFDQARPGRNKAASSYRSYRTHQKSMCSSIIPIADNIQLTWLKRQNLIAMASPPGLSVELGALENIMIGSKKLTPLEVLEIKRHTGDLIYRKNPLHPGLGGGSDHPVTPNDGGAGPALAETVDTINRDLEFINDITGINEYMTNSAVDPNAPVWAGKNAVIAGNNIINGLYVGYKYIKEETARMMSLRWQIVARHKDIDAHFYAIGKGVLTSVKYNSDMSFGEQAIKLEVLPNEDQKKLLLEAALQSMNNKKQGGVGITSGDFFYVQQMIESGGFKKAQLYLSYKEEEDARRADEMAMARIEKQNEGLLEIKKQELEGAQQKTELDTDGKKEVEITKSSLRQDEEDNRHDNKMDEIGASARNEKDNKLAQKAADAERQSEINETALISAAMSKEKEQNSTKQSKTK